MPTKQRVEKPKPQRSRTKTDPESQKTTTTKHSTKEDLKDLLDEVDGILATVEIAAETYRQQGGQ